jgi:plasmid stabilization system protein ParE
MVGTTYEKFNVILSLRAEKQWHKILAFYTKRNQSSEYSKKLNEKLQILLNSLENKNSLHGEKTIQRKLRRISFENRFAVFFRIKQDRIEITSIVDARRNIRIN